jgi:predicted  nucleic acid-binding Zn-ribbon protein
MNSSLVRRVSVALTLTIAFAISSAPAAAQTTDAAARELAAIRTTLDQLVVILKELVQQSAKRDRVAALTQRIQSAQRRLQPAEDELRALRERRQKEDTEMTGLRGSLDALAEMAKQDVTGSAAAAFENERNRINTAMAQKNGSSQQTANELAALEADVAARRAALDELERALDRELASR